MFNNLLQVLSAVKKDGLALEHVPEHLKTDAVEAAAVAQHSGAAKFLRSALDKAEAVFKKIEEDLSAVVASSEPVAITTPADADTEPVANPIAADDIGAGSSDADTGAEPPVDADASAAAGEHDDAPSAEAVAALTLGGLAAAL